MAPAAATDTFIVDGTGNPWFYGDVGIRDDRIAGMTDESVDVVVSDVRMPGMDGYEVAAPFIPTGDAEGDRAAAGELAAAGCTFAQVGPPPTGQPLAEVQAWVAAGPPQLLP